MWSGAKNSVSLLLLMKFSRIQIEYSPINLLAKFLSFSLLFRSTRILRQIVVIMPLFTGLLPHAMKIRRLYDECRATDTYNIMLASLGTTPLKTIYAGRLEYARVCVCLQVLRGK
jgi:hypothetical protein